MASEREAPVRERAEHLTQRIEKWRRGLIPQDALDGILNQAVMLLSALPLVRAQEPTDRLRYTPEQIEQQRRHCAEMQAFLRHTGTRANAPLKTATMCAEIAAVLDLYMEAIEAAALPPVQATTAEPMIDERRQAAADRMRRYFKPVPLTDAERLPDPDLLSSPLRETPDRARVRVLEEACRVALDVFRNAGQLTGHSGDEESGQHDEDCFACQADAALAQLSAALEGAATKHVNTKE